MHPLDATSFDQLDTEYLVDTKRSRLLLHRGLAHNDAALAAAVAVLKDRDTLANELLAMHPSLAPPPQSRWDQALEDWESSALAALRAAVAGRPYTPEEPLESQVSASVDALLRALVLARCGREKLAGTLAPARLAAEPRPVPGRPALGGGTIDFFEFTDIVDAVCARSHFELRERLAPALPHIRWHIVFAPTGFQSKADPTAAAIELIARRLPGRYWDVVTQVYRHQQLAEVGELAPVLIDLGIPYVGLDEEAAALVAAGGLAADRRIVHACAVPTNWPRYAIGRRVFIGTRQAEPILAEIEALRSAPAGAGADADEDDMPEDPRELSWGELMQTRFPSLDVRLELVPMLAAAQATRDLALLLAEALAARGVPDTRPYLAHAVAALRPPALSDVAAVEAAVWLVNLAEVSGVPIEPVPTAWLDVLARHAGASQSIPWTLAAFTDIAQELPPLRRFLRRFPPDLGISPFAWPHIFCLGRAWLARRGGAPLGQVAQQVHQQILRIAGVAD